MSASLVGSEMCIRDRLSQDPNSRHVMSWGHMSEALFELAEECPDQDQVAASIAAGIPHAVILSCKTP
eukprot:14606108-Alexandrium_andersonii.AAC.1